MRNHPGRSSPGSVEEEMALLADALRDAAREGVSADDDAAKPAPAWVSRSATPDGFDGETSSTCRGCPFCQGSAWLHTVAPEIVRTLADVTSALSAGLRRTAERLAEQDDRSDPRRDGSQRHRPGQAGDGNVPGETGRRPTDKEQQ